jgi:hypothetical protein
MKKKKSARAERRELARTREKLARSREKLWSLETGGSPERPLDVASASVIEPRATSEPCFRCGAYPRQVEHRAETIAGRRLRVVVARCPECGALRTWYFRLGSELAS